MTNESLNCLLHCAGAILNEDIQNVSAFNDFTHFCKILSIEESDGDFERINEVLSEFYKADIAEVIKSEASGQLSDIQLSQILLLSIVFYIVLNGSEQENSRLSQLCDCIPIEYHEVASVMLAPLIMKYRDGEELTTDDLNLSFFDSDKENDDSCLSPIKSIYRPIFGNEKVIALQKQQVHKSLKASQNFDPMTPVSMDRSCSPIQKSPLIKLVSYIQSPDYRKNLLKTNRKLEKNLNEMEYKLHNASNFESELQRRIDNFKNKCCQFEKQNRKLENELHMKDLVIQQKDEKISNFSAILVDKKRLEEKLKDYQEKVTEISYLSSSLQTKITENQKLKTENHNLVHFQTLAKRRRNEYEILLKDFEEQKRKCFELEETKEELRQSKQQMIELYNQINLLKSSSGNDSLVDISLNTSLCFPEPMSCVVEKERDELAIEIKCLRESTISNSIHESIVDDLRCELSNLQSALDEKDELLNVIESEQAKLLISCQSIKELIKNNSFSFTQHSPIVKCIINVDCPVFNPICSLLESLLLKGFENELSCQKVREDNENLTTTVSEADKLTIFLSEEIESLRSDLQIYKEKLQSISNMMNIDTSIESNEFVKLFDKEIYSTKDELVNYKVKLENSNFLLRETNAKVCSIGNIVCLFKTSLSSLKEEHVKSMDSFSEEINFITNTLNVISSHSYNLREENNRLMMDIDRLKTNLDERIKENDSLAEKYVDSTKRHTEVVTEMKMEREKLVVKYRHCQGSYETVSAALEEKEKLLLFETETSNKFKNQCELLDEKIEVLQKDLDKLITSNCNEGLLINEIQNKTELLKDLEMKLADKEKEVEELTSQMFIVKERHSDSTVWLKELQNIFELAYESLSFIHRKINPEGSIENNDESKNLLSLIQIVSDDYSRFEENSEKMKLLELSMKEEIATKDSEISNLQNNIDILLLKLKDLEIICDNNLENYKNSEDSYSKIEEKYRSLMEEKDEISKSYQSLVDQMYQMLKAHDNNAEIHEINPFMNQNYSSSNILILNVIKSLVDNSISLKNDFQKMSIQESQNQREIKSKNDKIETLRQNINVLLKDMATIEEKYSSCTTDYQNAMGSLSELTEEYAQLLKDKEIMKIDYENKLSSICETMKNISESISNPDANCDYITYAENGWDLIGFINDFILRSNIQKKELQRLKMEESKKTEEMLSKNEEIDWYKQNKDVMLKDFENLERKYQNYVEKLSISENKYMELNLEKESMTHNLQMDITASVEELKILNEKFVSQSVELKNSHELNFELKTRLLDYQKIVETNNKQIDTLSKLLKDNETSLGSKENEIRSLNVRISQMIVEINEIHTTVDGLNRQVKCFEETVRCKSNTIEDMQNLTDSLNQSVAKYKEKYDVLQRRMEEIQRATEMKEQELITAKTSLSSVNCKIKDLEQNLQKEIDNYEKRNEEYKIAEEESDEIRTKYDNLLKQYNTRVAHYEEVILQLNNKVHRIEETFDDQIQQFDKEYNDKIFMLEQNLEQKTSEIDILKIDLMETRKHNKYVRSNLESERDRLQKALNNRETQFSDELKQLKNSIENEREEKVKCKGNYEMEINKLQNELRLTKETNDLECKQFGERIAKLEADVAQAELVNHKTSGLLKEKEYQFTTEKSKLEARISDLSPLEEDVKKLSKIVQKLNLKLEKLEESEIVQELKNLRTMNKKLTEQIDSLDTINKDFKSEISILEHRIVGFNDKITEMCKENDELKNNSCFLQNKIYNLESLDKTRSDKLEICLRDIRSLNSENEALKTRYLRLREMNEKHNEEVMKNHEETVNSYIERLGSLTKDCTNFQEQVHMLTEEKNILLETNSLLKRSVNESTTKLDALQDVVNEYAQKEMNNLRMKFDENQRYSRMTNWALKPNLNRLLPTVRVLDKDFAESTGMDPVTRRKLESFIYSPFSCTDETENSFPINKSLNHSSPVVPPRKKDRRVDENITKNTTPLKRMKYEVKNHITAKIRKGLHLEESGSSVGRKPLDSISTNSSQTKTDENGSQMLRLHCKPPIPKPSVGNSRSNISDVVDFSRNKKQSTPSRSLGNCNIKDVKSRPSSTNMSKENESSLLSLFLENENADPSQATVDAFGENSTVLSTSVTIEAKTPKPSSVIKRLLRKSKKANPKTPFK